MNNKTRLEKLEKQRGPDDGLCHCDGRIPILDQRPGETEPTPPTCERCGRVKFSIIVRHVRTDEESDQ